MLLRTEIIECAARKLLIQAILDELEDADSGATLRPIDLDVVYGGKLDQSGSQRENEAVYLADLLLSAERDRIMYVMGYYVGSISQEWNNEVGLVFHYMGIIDDKDQSGLVLYRLIMSCWGHGVGIADDHSKEFDRAKKKLGYLEETPTHFDQHESWTSDFIDNYFVYPDSDV